MKFITLSIVWRRCSIAWIIQVALFMREAMKSRFSVVILPRVAGDLLVGARKAEARNPVSFRKT